MKLGFLVALLSAFGWAPAHAGAPSFTGNWQGKGRWESSSGQTDVPTTTLLAISADATSFRFEECWSYTDPAGDPKRSCISAGYDRDAHDALFHQGRKVGDIFPDHVRIFDGNPQVSEQIVLELGAMGQLHYRYTYLNFDGASERREANLSPVP